MLCINIQCTIVEAYSVCIKETIQKYSITLGNTLSVAWVLIPDYSRILVSESENGIGLPREDQVFLQLLISIIQLFTLTKGSNNVK